MSVTALAPPTEEQQLLDRVAHARADLTQADQGDASSLRDDQVASALHELAALEAQTAALRLRLQAEAERRALAAKAGDSGTDAWLAKLTGERRELLRGGLWLARRLQDSYHRTRRALAQGRISVSQARSIVQGLDVSHGDATDTQQAQAEDLLIDKATGASTRSGVGLGPNQLRRATRRAYHRIDAELGARHLERSVRKSERAARTNTWLTLHDQYDGTFTGRFTIPELHGQLLRAVLERLSSPRALSRDREGRQVQDESAGTGTFSWGWADKLGHAFCELLEHLPSDRLSRSSLSLLVTMPLDGLRETIGSPSVTPGVGAQPSDRHGSTDGVGMATTGADVTAEQVRRLACEAGIIPVVLGGASQPLDLGRTRRLHSEKQRQALALRHDSCAIAGCDRPFAWAEIHHVQPWSQGGPTDLANALPLCGFHHRRVHEADWRLVRHDEHEWTLRRRRTRTPARPTAEVGG